MTYNCEISEKFTYDEMKYFRDIVMNESRQTSPDITSKITIHEAVNRFELIKREEMILKLLMEGTRNAAICEQLGIRIKNRVQMFKMILE